MTILSVWRRSRTAIQPTKDVVSERLGSASEGSGEDVVHVAREARHRAHVPKRDRGLIVASRLKHPPGPEGRQEAGGDLRIGLVKGEDRLGDQRVARPVAG